MVVQLIGFSVSFISSFHFVLLNKISDEFEKSVSIDTSIYIYHKLLALTITRTYPNTIISKLAIIEKI